MGIGTDQDTSHWLSAPCGSHGTVGLNGTKWRTYPSTDHGTLLSDSNSRGWQKAGEDCQSGTKNLNACHSVSPSIFQSSANRA